MPEIAFNNPTAIVAAEMQRAVYMQRQRERQKSLIADSSGSNELSLAEFVEATSNLKLDYWQLDLCNRLQKLTTERGRRIAIHAPPQHGKSVILSQRFPAYLLRHNPLERIKLACYNVTHAARFGRVVRDLMISREVQALFPDPAMRVPPTAGGEEWSTAARASQRDAQPSFKALGLATGFVGQGFSCFPAETLISTEQGLLAISTLAQLKCPPRVFAYDHQTEQIVLRRIVATREIFADELREIKTVSGRTLRCTRDHRLFVAGRGYVAAETIAEGEAFAVRPAALHQMSKAFLAAERGVQEMDGAGLQRYLLRTGMFPRGSRPQEREQLQAVRQAQAGTPEPALLLGRVQDCRKRGVEVAQTGEHEDLRSLSSYLSPIVREKAILFAALRRRGPFTAHARSRQLALQGWSQLRQVVCRDASFGNGSRQAPLCGLSVTGAALDYSLEGAERFADESARSSHQPRSDRQPSRESHHALQEMPLQAPSLDADAVAVVHRVCPGRVSVYDLQVEGCHNFFANGILAHNCLLIDDPYSSPDEASSPIINESVWRFWKETAKPRANEESNVVLMFHRYTENDLAGRCLEEGGWELLRYAAIADGEYEHPVTRQKWPDPLNRQPGEKLSPRFSDKYYAEQQKNGYVWLSQFQGRPTAREGSFFKVGKFKYIDPLELPDNLRLVRAWDLAATDGAGDWTAGVLMGADDATGIWYVIDLVLGRWDTHERDKIIRETAAKDGPDVFIRGAQDPGSAGVTAARAFTSMLAGFGVRTQVVSGSKEKRAEGFSSQVNGGNVMVVRDAWRYDFIEQLRQFPMGSYDDIVDAAADAFNELVMGGGYKLDIIY